MRVTCPKCLPRLVQTRSVRSPIVAALRNPKPETSQTRILRAETNPSTALPIPSNPPPYSHAHAPQRLQTSTSSAGAFTEHRPAAKLEPELVHEPTSSESAWTVRLLVPRRVEYPQLSHGTLIGHWRTFSNRAKARPTVSPYPRTDAWPTGFSAQRV